MNQEVTYGFLKAHPGVHYMGILLRLWGKQNGDLLPLQGTSVGVASRPKAKRYDTEFVIKTSQTHPHDPDLVGP